MRHTQLEQHSQVLLRSRTPRVQRALSGCLVSVAILLLLSSPVCSRFAGPHIREAHPNYCEHEVIVLCAPDLRGGDACLNEDGPQPVAGVTVVVPCLPCRGIGT